MISIFNELNLPLAIMDRNLLH